MQVENITNAIEKQFYFKELESYKYGIQLTLSQDTSNCKLSYIHQGGNLINLNNKDRKEVINYLLNKAKGCVIFNTTSKQVADFISKTYVIYYYNEVPIGYNNGFQYHICIKNDVSINAACRNPIVVKEVKAVNGLNKINVKEKLLTILKTKRRKDDYVDEFIKTL